MSAVIAAQDFAPVAHLSNATTLLTAIERAASNPETDMDKMERLFSMHQAMIKQEAEVAFNAALAQAQSEITTVARNKVNTHTNSRYSDLDAIINAVAPVYTKHGFSISFNTEPTENMNILRVVAVLSHAAGHSRTYKLDAPLDAAGSGGKVNKTAIQATGSTNSYARRYLVCMIFNVTTSDDADGNKREKPATMPEGQKADFIAAIASADMDGCAALWQKIIAATPNDADTRDELRAAMLARKKALTK